MSETLSFEGILPYRDTTPFIPRECNRVSAILPANFGAAFSDKHLSPHTWAISSECKVRTTRSDFFDPTVNFFGVMPFLVKTGVSNGEKSECDCRVSVGGSPCSHQRHVSERHLPAAPLPGKTQVLPFGESLRSPF